MSRTAAPVVRAEGGCTRPEDLARAFEDWSEGDPRPWPVSFRAWADSRELEVSVEREVRITVLRRRNFGREEQ